MFAICPISIIPVRKEPNDRSEMVSQLLFGERVEIMEKDGAWLRVRILYDNYPGWIDSKQLIALTDEEEKKFETTPATESLDIVQLVIFGTNQIIPIVLGSSLPGYSGKQFTFSGINFTYEGNVITRNAPDISNLIEYAYMYLNAPYLWGGRSTFGIDCSGFTQMVYKLSGIKILRDAAQQAEQGQTVNQVAESIPGDLAFFENKEGRIVHTGIILPGNKIIHASGRVKVDRLDQQGIMNQDTNEYTHKLRLIKRYI